jgi:hypothetical protein
MLLNVATVLAAILLATASGCGYGHRIAYHVFEGPLDAISVAPAGPDKIIVLAGTVDAGKNVSVFYNSIHSQEIMRFPVSRFASALRGVGENRFYLSIAASVPSKQGRPKTWGAIEEWNLDGQLLSSTRFPGEILALTKTDRSTIYALMATPQAPIAVGIRLSDGRAIGSISLPDDADTLDECDFRGQRYLLYSTRGSHQVRLVSTNSSETIETPMVASQPRCFSELSTIVGIASRTFGVDVAVLQLSATNQRFDAIVAPSDTVEVEPAEDGGLVLLRRFGGDSNIQIWSHSEVADAVN